jgi:hypothetical protein
MESSALSPLPEVLYVPLVDALLFTTPTLPGWLAVAEQLHWPLALFEQVAVAQPAAVKRLPILAHSTLTDETDRHAALNGNVMEPVVVVLSAYVPLALAVHVPVTCRDPATGTDWHPRERSFTSKSPDRLRHDDVTFQVPTTSPPHGVAVGQLLPVLPPLPGEPPLPPPPPPELPQPWVAIEARASALTSPKSPFRMKPHDNVASVGCSFDIDLS